jgi:type II secretory pathway pseudopilin PulG
MGARSHRAKDRGFSPVELAAAIALVGSLVAIAVPAFLRDFKSSRFVEPTEGLANIASGAVAYAALHGGAASGSLAFPRTVGLTPSSPARGRLVADPPGTWDDPTWHALGFPRSGDGFAFADGDPHAFAFAFDARPFASSGPMGQPRSSFVAHAHGDLDGDGAESTFEVRGSYSASEGAVVDPHMVVESPLE